MIVLGGKDHTLVNEHEKIQSCNYLAFLVPNFIYVTQILESSTTELLLTPCMLNVGDRGGEGKRSQPLGTGGGSVSLFIVDLLDLEITLTLPALVKIHQ